MPIAALGLSHSPLKGLVSAPRDAERRHDQALAAAARWIGEFAPDLIVIFGPDHYRGFFNDLMPSFCIGIEAQSIGDWKTSCGPLNVPADTARACVAHLLRHGIDTAFSYRMKVDHGLVQPFDWLGIGLTAVPILPIFINCWAKPLPSFRRVREFGAEVGRFAAGLRRKVLLLGSGGISHDPPIPRLEDAPPAVRERLIVRRDMTAEELDDVIVRVTAEAREMASGRSRHLLPDESWDRRLLAILQGGDLAQFDAFGDDIERMAGRGVHEMRTWLAAFSALQAAGGAYRADLLYQCVVTEWLTGMGILKAAPVHAS